MPNTGHKQPLARYPDTIPILTSSVGNGNGQGSTQGGTTDLVLLLQSNHFREVDYGAFHAGKMADNMPSQATRYPIMLSTPVYAFHDNEDLLPRAVCAGLPFHHCLTEKSFQVCHV